MQSKELAEIAGVTGKTLRHYHKIGILPEAGRGENNYRSYSVTHLARLLHITRLAALGLSLDKIGELLRGQSASAHDVLNGLDRNLRDQVEHLNRKRSMIASLLAHDGVPDVPVQLARFYKQFIDFPEQVLRQLREQLVLLELALDQENMSLLVKYLDRVIAPPHQDMALDLARRFYLLDSMTSPDEVADLVEGFADAYASLSEGTSIAERPQANRKVRFLFEHILLSMNARQREVFILIAQRYATSPPDPASAQR